MARDLSTGVRLRGLTLELSGPQRRGALPARPMTDKAGSRAARHAAEGLLERLVRHRCAVCAAEPGYEARCPLEGCALRGDR